MDVMRFCLLNLQALYGSKALEHGLFDISSIT